MTVWTRSREGPSTAPTFSCPGMLHGKVLRSPHAHARIKSLNTQKAEALYGVKAVMTAADFPDAGSRTANLGELGEVLLKPMCDNVMASDKAVYHGHAVAAVAATSPHIAEGSSQAD